MASRRIRAAELVCPRCGRHRGKDYKVSKAARSGMSVNIFEQRRRRHRRGLVPLRQEQEARAGGATIAQQLDRTQLWNESEPEHGPLPAGTSSVAVDCARLITSHRSEAPGALTLDSIVTESRLMKALECLS